MNLIIVLLIVNTPWRANDRRSISPHVCIHYSRGMIYQVRGISLLIRVTSMGISYIQDRTHDECSKIARMTHVMFFRACIISLSFLAVVHSFRRVWALVREALTQELTASSGHCHASPPVFQAHPLLPPSPPRERKRACCLHGKTQWSTYSSLLIV